MSLKRKKEESDDESENKKQKCCSGGEFLIKLKDGTITENELQSVINLLEEGVESKAFVEDYLENKGTFLDLIEMLERDLTYSKLLIFEIGNGILLEIVANHAKHHEDTIDACKYFVNNHIQRINSMLTMTLRDKKTILCMLTRCVMLSPSVGKEVILSIQFTDEMLQDLTKPDTRTEFLHFFISFLIDKHYPLMLNLFSRRNILNTLLSSIRNDGSENICLLLDTLRVKVVENESFAKPYKLKVFNRSNLLRIGFMYFWNPKYLAPSNEERNTVKMSVHNLMLVLCTSIKRGLIFRDTSVSTGPPANRRMAAVILVWEKNRCACRLLDELVIKMAVECTDYVRYVWKTLLRAMENFAHENWRDLVVFARKFVAAFDLQSRVFLLRQFTPHQFERVIEFTIMPITFQAFLLKTRELYINIDSLIEFARLINAILNTMLHYLDLASQIYNEEQQRSIKDYVGELIGKCLPNAAVLFKKFEIECKQRVYLNAIINICVIYQKLYPLHLVDLEHVITLEKLFAHIDEMSADGEDSCNIGIGLLRIYMQIDRAAFAATQKMFKLSLHRFLPHAKQANVYAALLQLFRLSGLFDGCEYEIDLWLDAFKYEKYQKYQLIEYFIELCNLTAANLNALLTTITDFKLKTYNSTHSDREANLFDFLMKQILLQRVQRNLSPLLINAMQQQKQVKRLIREFIGYVLIDVFHHQTNLVLYQRLADAYFIDACKEYVINWPMELENDFMPNELKALSKSILQGNIDLFNAHCNDETLKSTILNMCVFYLINLNEDVGEASYNICLEVTKRFLDVDVILGNDLLIDKFAPLDDLNYCTKYLTDLVSLQPDAQQRNDAILLPYQTKLAACLKKLISNGDVNKQGHALLHQFDVFQLKYDQCIQLMHPLAAISPNNYTLNATRAVSCDLLAILLRCLMKLYEKDDTLDCMSVKLLRRFYIILTHLNEENVRCDDYADDLFKYLVKFPHQLDIQHHTLILGILKRRDYCAANMKLCMKLIENLKCLQKVFTDDVLDVLMERKEFLLPTLVALAKTQTRLPMLEQIYKRIEAMIVDLVEKPESADASVRCYYDGLVHLISLYGSRAMVLEQLNGVKRYATCELFHMEMLRAIYRRQMISYTTEHTGYAILTFVHLLVSYLKRYDQQRDANELNQICLSAWRHMSHLKRHNALNLCDFSGNKTFKQFCVLCLKYGISADNKLTAILSLLLREVTIAVDELQRIIDMIFTHSEFLKIALGAHSTMKFNLFEIILDLLRINGALMKKEHLPIFFASYHATISSSDVIILHILRLYESKADQTGFYDFKPFLWGIQAMTHYSVGQQSEEKTYIKQINPESILTELDTEMVENTITHFLASTYHDKAKETKEEIPKEKMYDLNYLLPVFAHILSTESTLRPFFFTRHGGMSLTVIAFSCRMPYMRHIAGLILSRFYDKVDAMGMATPLWRNYIDSIRHARIPHACVDDFRVNNFVALFLARSADILSNPRHELYAAIANYYTACEEKNFTKVPEMLTFFMSASMNGDHRLDFLLKLLRDGALRKIELSVLVGANAFKRLFELYSSVVCREEQKIYILETIRNICRIEGGALFMLKEYALMAWLYNVLELHSDINRDNLAVLLDIFNVISTQVPSIVDSELLRMSICKILDDHMHLAFAENELMLLCKICWRYFKKRPTFLTRQRLELLINYINNKEIHYIYKYKHKSAVSHEDEDKGLIYHAKVLLNQFMKTVH